MNCTACFVNKYKNVLNFNQDRKYCNVKFECGNIVTI